MKTIDKQFVVTQQERLEKGTIRTYSDGEEYLTSPGFAPVLYKAFVTHCKGLGWKIEK